MKSLRAARNQRLRYSSTIDLDKNMHEMCITVGTAEAQFIIERDTSMKTPTPPIRSVAEAQIKMSYQTVCKDSAKTHFLCTKEDLKACIIQKKLKMKRCHIKKKKINNIYSRLTFGLRKHK